MKLYVREPGTEQMLQLTGRASGNTLAILSLARAEFRAALRRRERAGDVLHEAVDEALARVEGHLQYRYLVQPVTDAVIEQAMALLDRHPLRAYDAVQLAGCLSLQSRIERGASFVCSDDDLLAAASEEGLSIFNPTAQVP